MGERPGPFRVHDRWEWVECTADDKDYADVIGLAIEVRTTITNREQQELQDRHDEVIRYEAEFGAMEPADKAKVPEDDRPWARQRRLIAPLVRGWNAQGLDADGNEVDLPPPAEAGPDAFEAISWTAELWITNVVLWGYRVTGKAGGRRVPSTPTSG